MKLTIADIKMLAELERKMDSGEQPFVLWENQRWAFRPEILEECGVVAGQTISSVIYRALLEASILYGQRKIDEEAFPSELEL